MQATVILWYCMLQLYGVCTMQRPNLFAVEHVRSRSKHCLHTTRIFEVHKAEAARLARCWVHDHNTVKHFSKPAEVLQQRCLQQTNSITFDDKSTAAKRQAGTMTHWQWNLLGRAGHCPPTFWLLWAAPISGPLTFLGDVNFFFLYIAIISYNKLRLNVPRMLQMAV